MHHSFSSRLRLLAIDELHLVSEWKDFRPEYSELHMLRSRIPAHVPVLGVSATLDPQTLEWIKESAGFDPNVKTLRSSIDRPEIYFQISCLDESERSMLNLQSVLPQTVTRFSDVPKTIIYIDGVAQICKAFQLFQTWMRQLNYPPESKSWIATYFSDMATADKERIDADFTRFSAECSSPRIVLATDAYGLGVDNPDVELVIQWLLPQSIQRLYQRMGRAMRCGRGRAVFILMHQSWCVGERSKAPVRKVKFRGAAEQDATSSACQDVDESDASIEDETPKSSSRKTAADRRRDMPKGLYDIINPGSDGCPRILGLRFFGDETYSQSMEKPQPCCDVCDPASGRKIAAYSALMPQKSADSLRRPWFRDSLSRWRTDLATALSVDCGFNVPDSVVMADEYLELLAKWGSDIVDQTGMLRLAGPWAEMSTYGDEILEILKTGQSMSTNDSSSPAFQAWASHCDGTKRQRLYKVKRAPTVKSAEERRNAWLSGRGLLPASAPRSSTAAKNGSQTAATSESTSGQDESVLRKASQSAHICDQEPVVSSAEALSRSPRRSRQPLMEIENVESQSQMTLADSTFGRKRRRPARLNS